MKYSGFKMQMGSKTLAILFLLAPIGNIILSFAGSGIKNWYKFDILVPFLLTIPIFEWIWLSFLFGTGLLLFSKPWLLKIKSNDLLKINSEKNIDQVSMVCVLLSIILSLISNVYHIFKADLSGIEGGIESKYLIFFSTSSFLATLLFGYFIFTPKSLAISLRPLSKFVRLMISKNWRTELETWIVARRRSGA